MKQYSEFEVQSEIFHRLRCKYKVKGELKLGGLRADLAILVGDEIACLIEVKNTSVNSIEEHKYRKNQWSKTTQFRKYKDSGYPFFYCSGYFYINELVKEIDEYMENPILHPIKRLTVMNKTKQKKLIEGTSNVSRAIQISQNSDYYMTEAERKNLANNMYKARYR
jgi:hypothetical protein